MKATKRLLALFLCLVMLFTSVPMEAFATGEDTSGETVVNESSTTENESGSDADVVPEGDAEEGTQEEVTSGEAEAEQPAAEDSEADEQADADSSDEAEQPAEEEQTSDEAEQPAEEEQTSDEAEQPAEEEQTSGEAELPEREDLEKSDEANAASTDEAQPEAEIDAQAETGVVMVEHNGETTYYADLQKAFDGFAPSNNTYGGTYVVTLLGNTTGVSKTLQYATETLHITLDLNGFTVDGQGAGYTVNITLGPKNSVVGGDFTIMDSSGNNSGKITGGKGGVKLDGKGCTLYFQGGTITGNHGGSKGGGIMMGATAFLEMTGGIITGNSVTGTSMANTGLGGGVLVNYGSITGGAIYGNVANAGSHAQTGRGGGVCTEITRTKGYSTLNIANGVVFGNTAENAGDDIMAQGNGQSGTKFTFSIGTENWYIDGWNGKKATTGNGETARYSAENSVAYTTGGFADTYNISVGLKYVAPAKEEETPPAAPDVNNASYDALYMFVCTTKLPAGAYHQSTGIAFDTGYSVAGEPFKNDAGEWVVEVTNKVKAMWEDFTGKLYASWYSDYAHAPHEELPEELTVTLTWNAEEEKWRYYDAPVYYDISCKAELESSGKIIRAYLNPNKGSGRIYVDLGNVSYNESVELKLYSGETLLTTATLNTNEYPGPATKNELTGSICMVAGESDTWPNTPWNAFENMVPDKIELVVDGQVVDTITSIQGTRDGAAMTAEDWAAFPNTIAVPAAPEQGNTTDKLVTIICDSDEDHSVVYGKWYPQNCKTMSDIVWNDELNAWTVDVRVDSMEWYYVHLALEGTYNNIHHVLASSNYVDTTLVWDAEQNLWVPTETIEVHATCKTKPDAPAYRLQLEGYQVKVYGDVNGEQMAWTTTIPEDGYTIGEVYGSREEGFFVDVTVNLSEGDIYQKTWIENRNPGCYYNYDWDKTEKTVTFTLKYNGDLNGTLYGNRHASNNNYDWVLASDGMHYGVIAEAHLKQITATVSLVIYRNGDTTTPYKTVSLGQIGKGETLDLTTLNIADYYSSTHGFEMVAGWYNDGLWNSYKAGKNPAGLEEIKINGWTNIICMVVDYQPVVVKAVVNGDKDNAETIFNGKALKGSNLIEWLDANVDVPARTGYKLDKWYNWDWYGHKVGDNATVNGWTNVYVDYQANEYILTLDPNGGKVNPSTITVTYDAAIGELPVPTKAEATFLGWYDEQGNEVTAETVYTVAGDSTITAKWLPNPDVSYVTKELFTIQCTEKHEHSWLCNWFGSHVTFVKDSVKWNEELGRWEAQCKIGSSMLSQINSTQPKKNYFGGIKHYYDETNYVFDLYYDPNFTGLNSAKKEVTGMWLPVQEYVVPVYCYTAPSMPDLSKVTSIVIWARDTGNKLMTHSQKFTVKQLPEGSYTVGQMYTENGKFYVDVTVTDLSAIIKALGEKTGKTYVLPAWEKHYSSAGDFSFTLVYTGSTTDYKQDGTGWSLDDSDRTSSEKTNGKSLWLTEQYTVTYTDGAEGKVFADQVITVNAYTENGATKNAVTDFSATATPTIEVPARKGYTHTGWNPEWSETVTGDVTYEATWTKNVYNITVEANEGGTVEVQETATFNDIVKLAITPDRGYKVVSAKLHYEVDGTPYTTELLKADGSTAKVFKMPAADVKIVVVFEQIIYNITVEAGEHGTVTVQSKAVYGDVVPLTITPDAGYKVVSAKLHYVSNGTPVTTELLKADGSTAKVFKLIADVTIVVTFAPNDYTLILDANGGIVNPAAMVVTFDAVIGELPEPTRENFVFQGWFDAEGNEVTAETVYTVAGDSTVTAKWAPAVAKIESTGKYYTSLQEALNDANLLLGGSSTAETVTLVADTTENILVVWKTASSKSTVTIDLNGHTVSGDGTTAVFNFTKVTGSAHKGINIIFTDSSEAKTGTVTGGIGFKNGGFLRGGAIFVNSGVGTVTINNGTFTENSAATGGAIYGGKNTVVINGGVFTKNTATSSGGAIWAQNLTVNGGKITGNTAKEGGGIYVQNSTAVLNVTGGEIYGNTAETAGNDIYFKNTGRDGSLKLVAPKTEGYTGWYVDGYLNGETERYSAEYNVEYTEYNLTGLKKHTVALTAGKASYTVTYTDGVEDAVIFEDQVYYVFAGSETPVIAEPTRDLFVFMGWTPEVAQTVTADATYVAQWAPAVAKIESTGKYYTSLQEALNDANLLLGGSSTAETVTLVADTTENILVTWKTASSKSTVTIDLNGHTVSGDGTTAVFNFTKATGSAHKGINIIFTDSSEAKTGTVTGGIGFKNGGFLRGGAIFVNSGVGTVTINNGTFTENSAATGGAIYGGKNTVVINGGVFTKNTATSSGGAIWAQNLTVNGGKITGNTAKEGGGIYVQNSTAVLNVTGGEIYGNTAETAGNDIYFKNTSRDGSLNLVAPKTEGYTGWYVDGMLGTETTDRYSVEYNVEHTEYNLTGLKRYTVALTAGNPSYTISFNPNGGAPIDSIKRFVGDKYGRLPSSALPGFSGGDSNWYLVDENGNVTETKITSLLAVSVARDHELFVVRKILNPSLKITLEVPGAISNDYKYYVPGNSTRILTVTISNMNADELAYAYQWYKDGVAIEGATEAVLTLPGNVSDTGIYKVVVTATLKDGSKVIVTNESASAEKEQKVQIMYASNTLRLNENYGENPATSDSYFGSNGLCTIRTAAGARTGYTFLGWNTAADGSGTMYQKGDTFTFPGENGNGGIVLELFAQWKANEYTVNLNPNGGTVEPTTLTVSYGQPIGELPVPVKPGYTFVGWTVETATYSAEVVLVTPETIYDLTEDLNLVAVWTVNGYTLTLDPNGGKADKDSVAVTYDAVIGELPVPTREGYTFAGWFDAEGKEITAETVYTVAGDSTATAKWTANTYKITLDPNGGKADKDSVAVTYDAVVGELPVPTREGYTFAGWFDAEGKEITAKTVYTVAGDSAATAKWTVNTYKITLDPNGGKADKDSVAVTYGEVIGELPVPTREGYTFAGWFDAEGKEITAKTVYTVTGDSTATAKWTANTYTITLNPKNGSLKKDETTVEVTFGEAVGVLPVPYREGYIFVGWFDADDNEVTKETVYNVADDITLIAKWYVHKPADPSSPPTGDGMTMFFMTSMLASAGALLFLLERKRRIQA